MKLLRRYQLDIVFFFFAMLLIVGLSFYGLRYIGLDPHDYEWYLAGPLVILYFIYLLRIRQSISLHERRKLTGYTLAYWIIMGIIIFGSYQTPIAADDFWSINALFLIFSLLLADSYWDFKRITLINIFKKKE